MKALLVGLTVAVAVTLGGCHVFKQVPEAKPVAVTAIQKSDKIAPSLQSLDLRVTALEDRLNKARAAREAKAKAEAAAEAPKAKSSFRPW